MSGSVIVAGVGMIPFTKPGQSEDWDVMAERATRLALTDAGIDYTLINQAFVGHVYGDSTSGQSALYRVGLTGIPIVNVNNNCSTGSTALYLARQLVDSGGADCVLALGFEQMVPGALPRIFADRKPIMSMFREALTEIQEFDPKAPAAAQMFGGAALEYQRRYGMADRTFAQISVKARKHAANNPLALFKEQLTVEQVLGSPQLYGPVTRYQACPPTCGAAAAVLCSPAFAKKHGLDASVSIKAQAMTTDFAESYADRSMIRLVGSDMTKAAAKQVYETAGIGPDDVQVVELHDCFTPAEIVAYEALGLVSEGGAEQYVLDGQNTYGGKHVVNPSGGLLSKGHPLGATGLAQCYELTRQLRGTAERRQVENATHGLQHNLGLGGACIVTLYAAA